MSSIRNRPMVVTLVGLVLTMIGWGLIQLTALDSTLKGQLMSDSDFARIDLFTVSDAGTEFITMELPTIPVKTALV